LPPKVLGSRSLGFVQPQYSLISLALYSLVTAPTTFAAGEAYMKTNISAGITINVARGDSGFIVATPNGRIACSDMSAVLGVLNETLGPRPAVVENGSETLSAYEVKQAPVWKSLDAD
jgi:hypothetical protein